VSHRGSGNRSLCESYHDSQPGELGDYTLICYWLEAIAISFEQVLLHSKLTNFFFYMYVLLF